MEKMHSREFYLLIFLALAIYCPLQAFPQSQSSTPFSVALETLQKQIGYNFENIGLVRHAMTHASYSNENNKALSVLGGSLIETSVSLRSLTKDIDISAKDLNRRISEISKVDTSCAVDGTRLGLQKVVRVSFKTNSSAPAVVCGAFRALFGAIAVDTGKSDDAQTVFWSVHAAQTGNVFQRSISDSV